MKYACIPRDGYTTFCLSVHILMSAGCFQFLAVVIKDIMNVCSYVSFCVAVCFYISLANT